MVQITNEGGGGIDLKLSRLVGLLPSSVGRRGLGFASKSVRLSVYDALRIMKFSLKVFLTAKGDITIALIFKALPLKMVLVPRCTRSMDSLRNFLTIF